MCLNKVGLEVSADCYMGKVPVYCQELGLGMVLSIVQLNPSLLHIS